MIVTSVSKEHDEWSRCWHRCNSSQNRTFKSLGLASCAAEMLTSRARAFTLPFGRSRASLSFVILISLYSEDWFDELCMHAHLVAFIHTNFWTHGEGMLRGPALLRSQEGSFFQFCWRLKYFFSTQHSIPSMIVVISIPISTCCTCAWISLIELCHGGEPKGTCQAFFGYTLVCTFFRYVFLQMNIIKYRGLVSFWHFVTFLCRLLIAQSSCCAGFFLNKSDNLHMAKEVPPSKNLSPRSQVFAR